MTQLQCYSCKYYMYKISYDFTDDWCDKKNTNRYFMMKWECPYWTKI